MKGCTIVIALRGGGREAGGRRPIRQDSLPCFQAAVHVAEQGCGWMSRLSARFDNAGRCVVSGGIEAESCSPGDQHKHNFRRPVLLTGLIWTWCVGEHAGC